MAYEVVKVIYVCPRHSAGQGCQAAISAERWLAAQGIE